MNLLVGLRFTKFLKFTEKFRELNSTIKRGTLNKRLVKINQLLDHYRLRPMANISYKRFAFEKNGLRMTLDTDLKCHFNSAS